MGSAVGAAGSNAPVDLIVISMGRRCWLSSQTLSRRDSDVACAGVDADAEILAGSDAARGFVGGRRRGRPPLCDAFGIWW